MKTIALVFVMWMACADRGRVTERVVRDRPVSFADATADVALDVVDTRDSVSETSTSEPDADTAGADAADIEDVEPDTEPDTEPDSAVLDTGPVSACPDDMRQVGAACLDRWEAPNVAGERPLVMYTFTEAAAWCAARDKRLCWDDEWLAACAGDDGLAYPYGATRVPGRCNDDKVWRLYTQSLLNGWPAAASSPSMATLDALLQAARDRGTAAAAAADHVLSLYQGTAAGERPACVGDAGVEDLVGNVEEWVRRRDGGGGPQFSGALVGRYWAESRTCQSHVTAHGDAFRFYEIGFRCCRDAETP